MFWVDELQDFGLEALRLIAALSPIASGDSDPLCVVGDGHQRIYNKIPIALSRAGLEVRGRSSRLKLITGPLRNPPVGPRPAYRHGN